MKKTNSFNSKTDITLQPIDDEEFDATKFLENMPSSSITNSSSPDLVLRWFVDENSEVYSEWVLEDSAIEDN